MDNIYQNNVYSLGKTMWHEKGTVGLIGESAVAVNNRMTTITYEQRPFGIFLNGAVTDTGKHYGIVRMSEDGEAVVGQTKGRYILIQPSEYAQVYDDYVGKPVETFGYLGNLGQRMFITSNLPAIDVHGDKVEMYMFLAVGFDGVFGEKVYQTGVRVVCQNTWNQAVGDSQNRFGGATFSAKHNQKDHLKDLGIWMKYITEQAEQSVKIYEGLYRKMEETPISVDEAGSLFSKVYTKSESIGAFYPDELRTRDQGAIDKKNEKAEEKIDIAMQLFKGAGIDITPTVWGAFNCVTEQENRHYASKKPIAESLLIGSRQTTMSYALDVMSEYVEVR